MSLESSPTSPRIAIPIPTSFDPEYNERAWPQYATAVQRAGGEPVPVPLSDSPARTAGLLATCSAVLLPGSGADVNPQKYGAEADPLSAAPDPARENVDELLLQDAHNMGKPIFAICFGTQMLNVWRGGTLIQDLPSALTGSPVNHKAGRTIAEAHQVTIVPGSLLASITGSQNADQTSQSAEPGTQRGQDPEHDQRPASLPAARLTVNSSHHQAIAIPGDGLRISARSPDDGVIEAIEGSLGGSLGGDRHARFILGVQWHPERTYDDSAASRALFARFIAEARAWSPRMPNTPGPTVNES
jgi:putative glutamine amidotransferase